MRLRAVPYEVPYRRPIQTAHGTLLTRRGWWVLAEDESGITGYGEVAPLPEWGTESFAEASEALLRLSTIPFEDLDDSPEGLDSAGLDRERLPATLAGVELALLDRHARRQDRSLASILSPAPRQRVALNALLTAPSLDALVEEAKQRVSEGFGTLKLKVGVEALTDDARRLAAIREAVGPTVRLRADANGAWDQTGAVAALKAFHSFDLDYLEQPVSDALGLARLRELGLVKIAADESAQDAQAVTWLLQEAAVDWLILKPMALGGLRYTRTLVEQAQKANIGVTLTSVLDRGVGTAGALHLAAALDTETACGLSNTHMASEHFLGPSPQHGTLEATGPGHGVHVVDVTTIGGAQ